MSEERAKYDVGAAAPEIEWPTWCPKCGDRLAPLRNPESGDEVGRACPRNHYVWEPTEAAPETMTAEQVHEAYLDVLSKGYNVDITEDPDDQGRQWCAIILDQATWSGVDSDPFRAFEKAWRDWRRRDR